MRGIAGWLLVLAAAVAAGDDEVRWKATDDGSVRFAFPAAWQVEAVAPRGDNGLLAFEVRLPPRDRPFFRVTLWDLAGGCQTPRAQAYFERLMRMKEEETQSAEVVLKPLPHLVLRGRDHAGEFLHAVAYHVQNGHPLSLDYMGPVDLWEQARPGFLQAALSVTSRLPAWPPLPPGYAQVEKGDYLYLLHADAPKSAVTDLHRILKRQEKAHRKLHGASAKSIRWRSQIVVHADKAAASALCESAATSRHGHYLHSTEARLYAVPVEKGDEAAKAAFAREAYQLMHLRRYGGSHPRWLFVGEGTLVWSEQLAGESLPKVAGGLHADIPLGRLVPFATLVADSEHPLWSKQVFAYVALFHDGPRAYRAAFKSFLKDFQETGDWELAQETHLLSLDQEKLREAAEAYCGKLEAAR